MQELDLNLLSALDILLREQSVTIAAERMNRSVPAMSRTLARIRKLTGDPILVRAGMRLVPTPKAIELQPRLTTLMEEARALVSAARQTPLKELEVTFTIRAEEAFLVLVDEMNAMLEERAPKIQLRLIARSTEDFASLREGTVQLDIGEIKNRTPEMKLQKLFSSGSVGVARRDHPLFDQSITAKRYAAYRHVNASRRGIGHTPIDAELEKLKLKRTVSLVVPSFQAAILAAASSGLIATIPKILTSSAASLGLRSFQIPIPVQPITIFQAWHPRFDADPAHRFVRDCVLKACRLMLKRK
ncbi:MAG: LysR family transcriptional regulator [Terriglobia bacterium]